MILLKLLKPTIIPQKKTDWTIRINLYYWLLRKMMPIYMKGAVSDSIDLGNVQIIHNVRDFGFENELSRFNLNINPNLVKDRIPFYQKDNNYKRNNCFNWDESLMVYKGGQKYYIKHGKNLSVDTDIIGTLKTSSENESIQCTEFIANYQKQAIQYDNNVQQQPVKTNRKKIRVNDKVETDLPPKHTTKPTVTKKAGFDVNDIF